MILFVDKANKIIFFVNNYIMKIFGVCLNVSSGIK